MANPQTLEIPISGMYCTECTQHIQHALEKLHGIKSVNVFLGAEKAIVNSIPRRWICPTSALPFRGRDMTCPLRANLKLILPQWAMLRQAQHKLSTAD